MDLAEAKVPRELIPLKAPACAAAMLPRSCQCRPSSQILSLPPLAGGFLCSTIRRYSHVLADNLRDARGTSPRQPLGLLVGGGGVLLRQGPSGTRRPSRRRTQHCLRGSGSTAGRWSRRLRGARMFRGCCRDRDLFTLGPAICQVTSARPAAERREPHQASLRRRMWR
jgi:hypothetical protein